MYGRHVTTARRCDSICDRHRCGKCSGAKSDTYCSIGNAGRDTGYVRHDSTRLQARSQPSAGGSLGHAGTVWPRVAACIGLTTCADTADFSSSVAAGGPKAACNAGPTVITTGQ